MRKKSLLILVLSLFFITSACGSLAERMDVRVAVIKGPSGMGAARLMSENEAGNTENAYVLTVSGAPDAVVAGLLTGEYDVAALPTNAIAMLHAKTGGEVQCLAVSTLSNLYLLGRENIISSIFSPVLNLADLSIVCAGQGTTVQATVERLLQRAGNIHYVSEHTEAVAQAAIGKYDYVILPEPFVTILLKQDANFGILTDIGDLWREQGLGELPMGGVAVRKAFADENSKAVETFLKEYAQSVFYAKYYPEAAAPLMEQYDILPAGIAIEAIPRANMTFVSGGEMKELLLPYYQVLMEVNPNLIGGELPGDEYYYRAP